MHERERDCKIEAACPRDPEKESGNRRVRVWSGIAMDGTPIRKLSETKPPKSKTGLNLYSASNKAGSNPGINAQNSNRPGGREEDKGGEHNETKRNKNKTKKNEGYNKPEGCAVNSESLEKCLRVDFFF